MRIPAKVDYAIRAMAEIASHEGPIKADAIAVAQDLPISYLVGILGDLRRGRLVNSQRGPDGGFVLVRPASEIALADIFRVIDGPLAEVHDLSLSNLTYSGPAVDLRAIWVAVRASLRRVLESVSLDDLISGNLPDHIKELVAEYESATASTERP
ncbi:MAG TPA: Rrf2 family transcriptional regulator [Microthrixaceae bacterium]|nr:Rrf2 family transcriptional regulator [Microthrixaceae bacterium]